MKRRPAGCMRPAGRGPYASFLRRPGAADGLAAGAGRKTPAAPGGEEPAGADAWQPGKTGIMPG